jgi:type II secretory pathway component PulK
MREERMRKLTKWLVLGGTVLAVAACQKNQSDQNIAVDNIAANADVEALPPDESTETSSNELMNGTDNADVGDLNASSNSF